ncbi:PAF acetylhydrolase [Phlyctema vagabunda]|uniref:1-alkyl-2-acetylglycerophosphocholine esterase n=1 Tax=Phlyctema vagabunda TaxID=108571 RepID=A0ABR4PNR3_9HELO
MMAGHTSHASRTLAVFAGLLSIVASVEFPAPTGSYNTSLSIRQVTDYSRLDPFAPDVQPRTLMVSIFQPTSQKSCKPTTVSYMDEKTAAFEDTAYGAYGIPNGTFEQLSLQVCEPPKNVHQRENTEYPVLLFSGALATSRLFYNAIAQQVSSSGYIVVTIDHPYDSDIVVFPDGSRVLASDIDTDEQIELAVDTRAKDVSFVLNQFANSTFTKSIIPGVSCGLDIRKAGVFGHSLGGAAIAASMVNDSRLAGGINLDGTFFGPVIHSGLSKPFLIFGHEGKDTTTDPSWAAIWPKLTGWKRELMLNESQHYTFSDLPDIVSVLGIVDALPAEIDAVLGTLDGPRALKIVTDYVTLFFDMVLKGKKSKTLNGATSAYPEVSFGSP